MDDVALSGIPILVVGNKVDLPGHLTEKEIIQGLNLDYIFSNRWAVILTSAKKGTNIQDVVKWLVQSSKNERAE